MQNQQQSFDTKETNPLQSLDEWEDDVLERYPDPETVNKSREEFRNYEAPVRDTVKEFYRLNHQYQTYDFVKEKISRIIDLYDKDNFEGFKNYYSPKRPLTAENKISPPLH